jgi:3-hydroxyacyl-CoA dehydrogenase/enoyl-CoA hydratase/3-hydroxybutyryl-CoA epimerase
MNGPLRSIVAAQARKQVARRARREHYPAPYAIIDIWARYGGNALAVPVQDPSSLQAILRSPTAKNLVRVFFLQERLKCFGKDGDFAPSHVHVIGAGTMGGDIAAWCALRGLTVTLQDQNVERIAPAFKRAAALFGKKLRDPRQVRMTLDRLIPDPSGSGVRGADVVIEAIFENLEAKRALFAGIEPQLKPGAVMATNTSSLRLEDIGAGLADPTRLIGLHFFNPVAKMPLVEVVSAANTDAETAKRGLAFVRKIDRLPLPCLSSPGFLVNAVLAPYVLEAIRCVDEGLRPEAVDEAALAFGMPMGPLELADMAGLDIILAAGKQLASGAAAPRALEKLVGEGRLGRKAGRGFYTYADGKAKKANPGSVPRGLAERIVRPLLQAAQRCVAEGVVADADLADAGVIFGTGFAPFTGGPLNYLAAAGPDALPSLQVTMPPSDRLAQAA